MVSGLAVCQASLKTTGGRVSGVVGRTVLAAALLMGGGAMASDTEVMKELAPSGALMVGVVEAPIAGTFFVAKDKGTGKLRGVTIELGAALARKLGVPVEYRVFPNSGECTEATHSGKVAVAFMPMDEERRGRVAFGPAYYLLESTYLVSGASGIATLAEVDQPRVRVVGIANTTTIRASARTLKHTQPMPARSVEEAVGMIRSDLADALALSRDSLETFLAELPGARIVDGGFQQTGIAVAVPQNRPAALAYVATFLEEAKASGLVHKALEAVGMTSEGLAPVGH
jgi:polar amino acid transport system substrate-binding protein